jgi:ATP-dependent RNA helicase DDX55/SPB4
MGSNAIAGAWGTLQPTLSKSTLEVIESLGYGKMTPVQAATIPQFMSNKVSANRPSAMDAGCETRQA